MFNVSDNAMKGNESDDRNSQRHLSETSERQDQILNLLSKARELQFSGEHCKNYEQAAEMLKQALRLAQETSNKDSEAEICGNLAEVLLAMDCFVESLSYGQKCLSLSNEAGR